jgi:hypothetical protein
MLNLDLAVRIERDGQELFAGSLERTIAVIARTLDERGDPALIYWTETEVALE